MNQDVYTDRVCTLCLFLITMGIRRGVQNGHLPPLDIESKNQNFLESMKSVAHFRLI